MNTFMNQQQHLQQQQRRQQQYEWWKRKKEEEEKRRRQQKESFVQKRKNKLYPPYFTSKTTSNFDLSTEDLPDYDRYYDAPRRRRWGLKLFLFLVLCAALFFLYVILFGS